MKHLTFPIAILVVASSFNAYGIDTCQSVFGPSHMETNVPKRGDINFTLRSGAVEEHSIRDENTAAQIYIDANKDPYMFFAFPAGNSGVGIWFKSAEQRTSLRATSPIRSLKRERGLHGAVFDLESTSRELSIDDSILSSLRFIRDRELAHIKNPPKIPEAIRTVNTTVVGRKIIMQRKSLNGIVEYRLEMEMLGDTAIVEDAQGIRIVSPTQVRMRLTGLTSEKPLTPLTADQMFKPDYFKDIDPLKRDMLAFLFYREAILAGSPRYHSLFGRDTIFSTVALFKYLRPEAIEEILTTLSSGIDPATGELSHEKHNGEFVAHENYKNGLPHEGIDGTIEDRKMVDDDFAFTSLAAKYFETYPERSLAFLKRKDQRGLSVREILNQNFLHIQRSTAAFVRNPIARNLISFKESEPTGDWRDSEEGNNRQGRTFNVNAALVPGALKSLADLYGNPRTELYDASRAAELRRAFEVWNTEVPKLFIEHVSAETLYQKARAYMVSLGRDPNSLPPPPPEGITYYAISVSESGVRSPIIHSDDSLMMMFGHPSPEYLETVSQRIRLPFPYGLRTSVGIVIANAVLAAPKVQERFGLQKYHGAVIWTVQEDLLQLGIDRQLARTDLDARLKQDLLLSQQTIREVRKHRHATGHFEGAPEIFMIANEKGVEVAKPFVGDAIGNSNQLWSHLLIFSEE